MYLESWVRWPMESFWKDSPRGIQAIDSKVASSHVVSRPVASWDWQIRYCLRAGACVAVRMYSGILVVTWCGPWNSAAWVPGIYVGNKPVRFGRLS
jgi:hypothetical protein